MDKIPIYLVSYYDCEEYRCTVEVQALGQDEAIAKAKARAEETIIVIDCELTEQ